MTEKIPPAETVHKYLVMAEKNGLSGNRLNLFINWFIAMFPGKEKKSWFVEEWIEQFKGENPEKNMDQKGKRIYRELVQHSQETIWRMIS